MANTYDALELADHLERVAKILREHRGDVEAYVVNLAGQVQAAADLAIALVDDNGLLAGEPDSEPSYNRGSSLRAQGAQVHSEDELRIVFALAPRGGD